MTFKCHSAISIVALSTSKKWQFWFVKKKITLMWQLESSLNRLHQIAFSGSAGAENKLRRTFEALKHRFFGITQVAFWDGQRPNTSSNCHATHGNIAFSTSAKSHFVLVKRKKKSSPWLATWIIAFCINQIAFSASPVSENKLTLTHRFFHFIQKRILG